MSSSPDSFTFTLLDTPLLEWPSRVLTPVLQAATNHYNTDYQTARHREDGYRAATHPAMIAQSTLAFNQSIRTVVNTFDHVDPRETESPTPSEPYIPRTPSPEPLPVPPRTATPFPDDLTLDNENAEPLPNYADEPPQYTTQRSPSPAVSGDMAVSQGHWINNLLEDRPLHEVVVPNSQGGVVMASLVSYDFNADSPEILARRHSTATTYSYPLHAQPKPYRCHRFLKRERHLFDPTARHTDLLTHAVRKEGDVTLRAEVHRYRAKYVESRQKARRLAILKKEYNDNCRMMNDSMIRLAQVDAYIRLTTRMCDPHREGEGFTAEEWHEALASLRDDWRRLDPRQDPKCHWCGKANHDTHECGMLRQCLLCMGWGHHEKNCRIPHVHCEWERPCRIPWDMNHVPCHKSNPAIEDWA
jgi:hypothetical protein